MQPYRDCPFRSKALGLAALLVGLSSAMAPPAHAGPSDSELYFEPRSPFTQALPPLPGPGVFPVQLVLDDSTAEGVFGLSAGTARQFLWLNSFANPGAFALEEIWVLFPAGADVPLGGAVQLVVFLDPDGNPTNGATVLAAYDVVVQVKDGVTFSVYSLGTPLVFPGGGDVLIGVVNRYFTTGVDPPPTLPAALDTTASQGRSYFALWAGDAPDPPDLATASTIAAVGGAATGNFMIRGFGTPVSTPAENVPALGGAGLVLLAATLGFAGVVLGRRRR